MKIITSAEGITRLSQADLVQAGFTSSLESPHGLRLLHRGQTQPFWLDEIGDSPVLSFFAQGSQSEYIAENVYILESVSGTGGEETDQDAAPVKTPYAAVYSSLQLEPPPPGAFYQSVRSEENQRYLPQAQGDEHWFGEAIPGGGSQELGIEIGQLAPGGQAGIRLGVWGSTESPTNPDHHLRVSVNDNLAVDQTWEGQGYQVIQAVFDAALLREGENMISVHAPGDTRAAIEINFLDFVELLYPRRLIADRDRLEFVSPGGEISLTGFTSVPQVYEIISPDPVHRIDDLRIESTGSEEQVTFMSQAGARYLAVTQDAKIRPARIEPLAGVPDLHALEGGADYLVIGPPDLLEPLQPLLELRAAQGWTPLAIPLQAVYDQFNHGLPEPEAIQRFIRFASDQWQPAPRALLLVGDATYDPLGYQTSVQANRLPTFLVDTVYGGQTASDVAFVQLNDDPWPDLPIGRIPARTPVQVEAYVGKVLANENDTQAAVESSQPDILAIADGQEASFAHQAQDFLDAFGAGYETSLFAPPSGDTGAAEEINAMLSGGSLLAAYFGHGSVTMWGKDRLFTVEDAAKLDSAEHLPVVLNLTCLTGLFTHPEVESLAEALLFQPGAGASAVLAPSSLTLPDDQGFLVRPFVQAFVENPELTIGELHLAARRQIDASQPGQRDVMLTFMLFGDPTLNMQTR